MLSDFVNAKTVSATTGVPDLALEFYRKAGLLDDLELLIKLESLWVKGQKKKQPQEPTIYGR